MYIGTYYLFDVSVGLAQSKANGSAFKGPHNEIQNLLDILVKKCSPNFFFLNTFI